MMAIRAASLHERKNRTVPSLGRLSRLVRQPLVHFVLIGAAIFAVFGWFDDTPPATRTDRIVVAEARVAQLADGFAAVWRRTPTEDELRGLVDDFIREEVYVREALALGLDRDDALIRQRLRQKMEFLTASAADAVVPSEADLRAFYADRVGRFTTLPRIALDQVFLGEAPDQRAVADVLAALDRGVAHETLGARTLLPPSLPPSPANVVDGTFGRGVFEAVFDLQPGTWTGPVRSAYGSHLFRVTERTPATPLAFDAVRGEVEAEWRRARAEAFAEAHYQALRARYEIVRPEAINR
jgi:hypothetical protein